MPTRIEGLLAKIDRADEHLAQLKSDFTEGRNCQVVTNEDADGNEVHRLWFPDERRLRVGVICGDVAHNLRSALDHLVYQLIQANNRTPSTKNDFPVAWDAKSWKKCVGRIEGVSDAAFKLIDDLQPYKILTHKERARHPIYILNALWNKDKHKVILPIALSATHTVRIRTRNPEFYLPNDGVPFPRKPDDDLFVHFAWTPTGPLEHGAHLLTVQKGDVLMDAHLTALVAFDPSGPGGGENVYELLDRISRFMRTTLERDFWPLLG